MAGLVPAIHVLFAFGDNEQVMDGRDKPDPVAVIVSHHNAAQRSQK
jgi:hypothetical protein